MALSSPPISQSEINLDVPKNSERYFVNQLISQVQKDMSQKKRHTVKIVDRWMVCFEYIKQQEDFMLSSPSPLVDEKEFFESCIAVVYGLGLHVLRQLKQADELDLSDLLGVDFADIKSCVEELADMVRQAKRDYPVGWEDKLEREVFGE